MAFSKRVPRNFNWENEQTAQFANICPDMTLPPSAVFVAGTTLQGWTQPLMMRKGNTHYDLTTVGFESNGNAEAYSATHPNRKFSNAVRINDVFGMTSNTSKSQCEAYADTMPMDVSLTVLETQENVNYLAPDAIQWQWFHDRWKARCDAATAQDGRSRWRCHNYFHFSNGIFALGGSELNRQLYTTPVTQWQNITYVDGFGITQRAVNDFSPGGRLASTNLVTEGIYMGNPDDDAQRFMQALFAMDVTRMQGKKPGLFVFGVREWRPGFLEGTTYSDGRFMRRMKEKLPPTLLMDCGFMAQEFGGSIGGCGIEYGAIGYQPITKKPVEYYAPVHDGSDYWKKNGDSDYSEMPYYGGAGNGRFQFGGGDFFYFGTKQWNDTVGQVYQGTPTFLRYQINDGPWIEKAPSESDIVTARRDKRGLCRGRIHNGKIAVWYMNKYADDHVKRTIRYQHPTNPGITWTDTICGTGVHSKIFDL